MKKGILFCAFLSAGIVVALLFGLQLFMRKITLWRLNSITRLKAA